mgnify:CR=1 FL=1
MAALPLQRVESPDPARAGAIQQPVQLTRVDQHWQLSNGLVLAEFDPSGLVQLRGADGVPQLQGPLEWCRWADRGEFWDAWDIAADYREQPLPLEWQGTPELVEQGPLCCRLLWRGRCGSW